METTIDQGKEINRRNWKILMNVVSSLVSFKCKLSEKNIDKYFYYFELHYQDKFKTILLTLQEMAKNKKSRKLNKKEVKYVRTECEKFADEIVNYIKN